MILDSEKRYANIKTDEARRARIRANLDRLIHGEFYLKCDGVRESLPSWRVRGRSFTAYDLFAKAGFNNISAGDKRILKKVRIYVESFEETTDDELNIKRKNWRYKVRFGNAVDCELEGVRFNVRDNFPEECGLDVEYEFGFKRF